MISKKPKLTYVLIVDEIYKGNFDHLTDIGNYMVSKDISEGLILTVTEVRIAKYPTEPEIEFQDGSFEDLP